MSPGQNVQARQNRQWPTPFIIPPRTLAISTEDLNNYSREWFEQRANEAENFSPENRIEDFINHVRERMNINNLDAQTEQMIREYAEQNINILFDGVFPPEGEGMRNENMPPQTGGRKRRRSRKRSTKKRSSSKKRRSSKRR
jgi:hypothetical protein